MSAMGFSCLHCGEPGISVTSKLMSAAATWWGWSATCELCGQRSRISGTAVNVQFGIFVAALATIPWLLAGDTRVAVGYLVAAAILAVGLFAPMKKDLMS